jgi:hypothetical protein
MKSFVYLFILKKIVLILKEIDLQSFRFIKINIYLLYIETFDGIIKYKFMRAINIGKIHNTTSIEMIYLIIN